jgi:hypothetical protein
VVVAGIEVDFLAERLERPLERHLVDRTALSRRTWIGSSFS